MKSQTACMRYLDSAGVPAHLPVPAGGVVCMMKSAPVVRGSVTQASGALPRPYIGGVGGPCWISLDSV